mmetsp:Transcript_459/g.1742  ORF Transcript_459/g.1742 Transcript_459/m.1742 type:complete len:1427 (+) Transcript_459:143-4423(+)
MGNQLAKAVTTRPAELLSDLPNVVYKDTLGGGRVLKTFVCVHDDGGLVVVKVYLKREGSPDLGSHKEELERIRDCLGGLSCPHLWPFQTWFESDNKAFLLRQYIFSNLYERISTRPFLSLPEKKWIAFQLLFALRQAHEKGVYHGDIKCENVLVTSWNWVYLSDFASAYKPTYLPADNPADFSFFFDAGSRRRCYVAPERFVDRVGTEAGQADGIQEGATPGTGGRSPEVFSPTASQTQGELNGAMDIFSLGCVLAELYMEGKSLFDLSELHAYRRGEYDPATIMASKVKDEKMRALILHMIQLDPSKRLTAKEYLSSNEWMAGKGSGGDGQDRNHAIFPPYMTQTLHGFYASLLPLEPDGRLSTIRLAYGQLKACVAGTGKEVGETKAAYTSEQRERLKEGMTILVSLLCSLLRNTKTPSSKCACIRLLCESGLYCDNERKMQHVVPYLLSMLNQGSTIVRSMALSALTTILKSVDALPASEEKVFSEYIFPSLALLCSDPEEMVRVQFASELSKLIEVACRLLRIPLRHAQGQGSTLKKLVDEKPADDAGAKEDRKTHASYLTVLKKEVSKILIDLTTGGHSTSATIQATMQNFEYFCDFFGVQETNNLLLPLFITFLNHNDWQVRRDFFNQLPTVCKYTVPRNGFGNAKVLEAFLIPCVEQAFVDPEPEVLASSLKCLSKLVESKSIGSSAYVLQKATLLGLIENCKPFLGTSPHAESQQRHPLVPSIPMQVFVSCVKFVAACARRLSQVDIFAHMLPRLKDVNWSVECPNLRDEMCIFDCLGMQNVRLEGSKLNLRSLHNQNVSTSPSESMRHRMQDSRLSPGIAIYSVAKSDFLSTPEHSLHSAVRTGALQNNSNLKKVLSTTAPETQRQPNDHITQGAPSASISILNESNFGFARQKQGNQPGRHAPLGEQPSTHNVVHQRNLSDAVVDALSTGVSGHANPHSYTYTWQPQGILISHLAEHKRAVNKLSLSHDMFFLTSASDDGTCKIWDCRKLEKDISFKSRLTYSHQGGRILSCVSLMHSKESVASASSDGTVHVWNVEYSTRQGVPEKYNGITRIGNVAKSAGSGVESEGAALNLCLCGEHVLCYATEHGKIHGYDHRQGKDAWELQVNPSHGILRSMFCESKNQSWLATISSFGVVSVLDLRFLMCAKQWQHPNKKGVHAMIPFNDVIASENSSESCRALISAGEHETAVWNIFDGRCEQVFRNLGVDEKAYEGNPISCSSALPVSGRNLSELDAGPEAVSNHLRSLDLGAGRAETQSTPPPSNLLEAHGRAGVGHRALLPLPNGGFLTAGSDRFIRFWHPHRFEYSYLMCAPAARQGCPGGGTADPVDWVIKPPVYYTKKIYNGISTVEEMRHASQPQGRQQKSLGGQKGGGKDKTGVGGTNACHEDCVLDLALFDTQERIILSSSRDGTIKGWK